MKEVPRVRASRQLKSTSVQVFDLILIHLVETPTPDIPTPAPDPRLTASASMGFLAPKDLSANPAPIEVYNWRVYLLAISAAMGSSMFGYDSAFIGGTMSLPSFQERFGLADAEKTALASLRANIVSTFQAGCFFGVLACYPTVERLGMKWTLVVCGAIFNLGAIIQTAATGQLAMIYAGRALTGKY